MAGSKRGASTTTTPAATLAKKEKKSVARRAKKTAAAARATRSADKPLAAAAPLLATAPKKVGKVTGKASDAVEPNARYQPKTDVAPGSQPNSKVPRAAAIQAFDPLALAQPWLRLGFQMAISNLTLHARIVRVAMDLPPTSAAMRQGSAAYKAWLALMGRTLPAKGQSS